MHRTAPFFVPLLFICLSTSAFAQADPGPIAQIRDYIDRLRIGERLNPEEGIYPRIGGLSTGSGIALGAGYRTRRSRSVPIDVSGVVSTRNYKEFDAKARWLSFAHDHMELW